MIFNGSDGGAVPGTLNLAASAVASWNVLPNDKADGGYLDFGYRLLPALELDLRYDRLNRVHKPLRGTSVHDLDAGRAYAFTEHTA